MRRWTASQDFRHEGKLSSTFLIIAANLFIGMAKLSVEPGTEGPGGNIKHPKNSPRVGRIHLEEREFHDEACSQRRKGNTRHSDQHRRSRPECKVPNRNIRKGRKKMVT